MTCDTIFSVDFQDVVFLFRGYFFVFSSVRPLNLWRLKFIFMKDKNNGCGRAMKSPISEKTNIG